MIASVLRLSRSDCKELGIRDAYSIHKIVYSLFPAQNGETRSFLYCDKGGDFNERLILLLSKEPPRTPEHGIIETRVIPDQFLEEDYYGFEVVLNPVTRDNKSRKILPVRGKEELLKWFTKKAPGYGFDILPDSLSIKETAVMQFEKSNEKVVLGKAVFIGKLKVTDRQLFIKAFHNGLGKGKAFGFGLFQVVPIALASVDA